MTVLNKHWTESDIICEALGERTVRDGADWINEALPETYRITYGTVHNWVSGKHEPEEVTVRALQMFYKLDDPRHQLGADIAALRIKKMEAESRIHWAKGAKQ